MLRELSIFECNQIKGGSLSAFEKKLITANGFFLVAMACVIGWNFQSCSKESPPAPTNRRAK